MFSKIQASIKPLEGKLIWNREGILKSLVLVTFLVCSLVTSVGYGVPLVVVYVIGVYSSSGDVTLQQLLCVNIYRHSWCL